MRPRIPRIISQPVRQKFGRRPVGRQSSSRLKQLTKLLDQQAQKSALAASKKAQPQSQSKPQTPPESAVKIIEKGFLPYIGPKNEARKKKNILIVTKAAPRIDLLEFWAIRMKSLKTRLVITGSINDEQLRLARSLQLETTDDIDQYLARHAQYTHCLMCSPYSLLCSQALETTYKYLDYYKSVGWADAYCYEWETGRLGYQSSSSQRITCISCSGLAQTPIPKQPEIYLSCKQEGCTVLNVKATTISPTFDSLVKANQIKPDISLSIRHLIRNTVIGRNVVMGKNIQIGKNSVIGNNVEIGDNTIIGAGSCIDSGVVIQENVKLGNNCQIGANSVIAKGVSVGAQVVIQPLTMVNRNRG